MREENPHYGIHLELIIEFLQIIESVENYHYHGTDICRQKV